MRFHRFSLLQALVVMLAPPAPRVATRTDTLNQRVIGIDEETGGIAAFSFPRVGRTLGTNAASAGWILRFAQSDTLGERSFGFPMNFSRHAETALRPPPAFI